MPADRSDRRTVCAGIPQALEQRKVQRHLGHAIIRSTVAHQIPRAGVNNGELGDPAERLDRSNEPGVVHAGCGHADPPDQSDMHALLRCHTC